MIHLARPPPCPPVRGGEPQIIGMGFYQNVAPGSFGPSEWLDLFMACQDGRATCMRVMEFIKRETVSVASVNRLRAQMLEVCWAIERLPAGEQQTALSIQASAVAQEMQRLAPYLAPPVSADSTKEEGHSTVQLCYPLRGDPFNKYDCKIVDVGHADNILVVECPEMRAKQDELWGGANYRLKYLADIMRALGMTISDEPERHVSEACELARRLSAPPAAPTLREAGEVPQTWAEGEQLLSELLAAGNTGLDGSPGDPLCKSAHDAIVYLSALGAPPASESAKGMSEGKTPETEGQLMSGLDYRHDGHVVRANFARRLEVERDEARKALILAKQQVEWMSNQRKTLAEWYAERSALSAELETAKGEIQDARDSFEEHGFKLSLSHNPKPLCNWVIDAMHQLERLAQLRTAPDEKGILQWMVDNKISIEHQNATGFNWNVTNPEGLDIGHDSLLHVIAEARHLTPASPDKKES